MPFYSLPSCGPLPERFVQIHVTRDVHIIKFVVTNAVLIKKKKKPGF